MTRSLIADATVNTDFAQVEEDVQQINLTRFSLQFPEKRDFFLEGQGIFNFGGTRGNSNDVPILFFSRRIGLSQGQSVPVFAGGRLTGTVGKFGIGALNIQTDDKPSAGAVATNFSVVRLKRDILRRSNIGLLATRRTPAASQAGSNAAFGTDANLAFFKNLSINGYSLYERGAPVSFDAKTVSASIKANRETSIVLTLREGIASIRFWTSAASSWLHWRHAMLFRPSISIGNLPLLHHSLGFAQTIKRKGVIALIGGHLRLPEKTIQRVLVLALQAVLQAGLEETGGQLILSLTEGQPPSPQGNSPQ